MCIQVFVTLSVNYIFFRQQSLVEIASTQTNEEYRDGFVTMGKKGLLSHELVFTEVKLTLICKANDKIKRLINFNMCT